MIVCGRENVNGYLNTGGKYNAGINSWTASSTSNAPTGRYSHTAVWTGSEMIVWGGIYDYSLFDTGGRYNPASNNCTVTSNYQFALALYPHTAVSTGFE